MKDKLKGAYQQHQERERRSCKRQGGDERKEEERGRSELPSVIKLSISM